eukprot:scaffold3350_cov268-Pinguiococcus_pyrenoidosus.AAC.36
MPTGTAPWSCVVGAGRLSKATSTPPHVQGREGAPCRYSTADHHDEPGCTPADASTRRQQLAGGPLAPTEKHQQHVVTAE